MIKNSAVSEGKVKGNGQAEPEVGLGLWLKSIIILFVLQMFGILILSSPNSIPIYVNHLSVNPIASSVTGSQVLSYSSSKIFQVSLVALIEILLFVSILIYFLQMSVYKKNYYQDLRLGSLRFRWIEYGLSIGLAMIIFGIVYGIYDVASLLMIFVFTIISSITGYILLGQRTLKNPNRGILLWSGIVCSLIPPAMSLLYLIYSQVYGNTKVNAYVYWLGVVTLVYLALFWNKIYSQISNGRKFDLIKSEKVYLVSNLAFKTLFVWLVFSGLLHS